MKHEGIAAMHAQRLRDIKAGVKHTPLYTLAECCEEAGVHPSWFGKMAKKYPGAPAPVIVSKATSTQHGRSYYRKKEVVQWVQQVKQQIEASKKGTLIMPDLKTALQTAIERAAQTLQPAPTPPKEIPADWDDEGGAQKIEEVSTNHATTKKEQTMPKHLFQATTNVSRETFNYVRDNPGCTRKQANSALVARGFNESSVDSLLGQMLKGGLLSGSLVDGMFANQKEYSPLKAALVRNKKPVQSKPGPKPKIRLQATPAPVVGEAPVGIAAVLPRKEAWSPQTHLEGLSVLQAKAVYDELKKLFN